MTISNHPFNDNESKVIGSIAALIIGPSAEFDLPGADDDQIVSRILCAGAKHEQVLRSAVDRFVDGQGGHAHVSHLDDEELKGLLAEYLRGDRPLAGLLMWLTAQAYYQDPRVLRSLGMSARPPFPEGHVVQQGDWSLLDPVRLKGKLYRDSPPDDE